MTPADDVPTLPPAAPTGPETLVPETATAAGAPNRLGRFVLERLLGEGGMGCVYLAFDPQLDRSVALKVPRRLGPAAEARFLREARAAAALRHPNLCPIFDLGIADGQPFLCLPYIAGRPLAGPLPVAGALRVCAAVARAMHHAHSHGVIHRDLKPANVMIDEADQPVVMDFGLARQDAPLAEQLTAQGEVMGTPAYMPPEQVAGDVARMGPACDIYSLGVILYQLLTGTLPFAGDLVSLATQIAFDPPAAPSSRNPALDAALDGLVLRALAKEPARRWPTMAAFAEAMEGYAPAAAALTLHVAGSGYAYRPAPGQAVVSVGRQKRRPGDPPTEGNDFVVRVSGNDELSVRISRRHLEIRTDAGRLTVTDRSKAGTRLNGRPLVPGEPTPLHAGDRLSLAGVLDLDVQGAAPAALATTMAQAAPAGGAEGRLVLEATQGDVVELSSSPLPALRERGRG
jgi:hypothetical protein